MSATLRFSESKHHVMITSETANAFLSGDVTVDAQNWLNAIVTTLDTGPAAVNIRLSRLRWPIDRSQHLAHILSEHLLRTLKQSYAPAEVYVEIDQIQQTTILPGHQVRTLLPHHDGGHCSYLTPSLLDVPHWEPRWRRFSNEHFTTTQAHKMYQGIFILDPGNGLSVTTYYDLLHIIKDAWIYQKQKPADAVELANWIGNNIKTSLEQQQLHHSRYLSVGGMLGSPQLLHHAFPVHYLEADFSEKDLALFPELQRLCDKANAMHSPTELYLDEVLEVTMGLNWESFRQHYETAVPSEQCDFIIGHNLSLLHGGLMGGSGRVFEPICFVMDDPQGDMYEQWLSKIWHRQ